MPAIGASVEMLHDDNVDYYLAENAKIRSTVMRLPMHSVPSF